MKNPYQKLLDEKIEYFVDDLDLEVDVIVAVLESEYDIEITEEEVKEIAWWRYGEGRKI